MAVLLSTTPYGSESPYNAFRLAEALALRDEHVEVFFMGDAVWAARAGQDPRGAQASLRQMAEALLKKGVDITCCGTCCTTRGLAEHDLIPQVHTSTVHDLAAAVTRADKAVSF